MAVTGTDQLAIDPHVKILDEGVVGRAKARGLDAIVYAPHFTRLPTIRERARQYSDDELLVIPGREVFTGSWRDRKHLLGLGMTEPVPDFITLEGAIDALARQGAAILVPHPGYLTVSLDAGDIARHADALHGVETYNPKHLPRHNRQARRLRTRVDLPGFASSYAHLPGSVGEVWTSFTGVDRSANAIVRALIAGHPRETGHRSGIGHRLRCTGELAHLLVENSWQKFDRVVLSGTEATHPRHPAYDGRFDHVACY